MKSKYNVCGLLVVGFTLALMSTTASWGSIIVPGTSDIWLAGMPDGSTASSGDVAPTHSPVLVTGINLSTVSSLTFSVTGGVSYGGGCPPSCFAPDGGGFFNHSAGAQNGIASVRAPRSSLIGVFLNDRQPDVTSAPTDLNFQTIGTNFTSLPPELKQVFFIGDGLTGTGMGNSQLFQVPSGATRLYLGTMDAFGWYNNTGAFSVEVAPVPLPGVIGLFGSGVLAIVGLRQARTGTGGASSSAIA